MDKTHETKPCADSHEAWRTETLPQILKELAEFGKAARPGADRCFPERIIAALNRAATAREALRAIIRDIRQKSIPGDFTESPGSVARVSYKDMADFADRLEAASGPYYSPETIRICFMGDYAFSLKEAERCHDEAFFGGKVDLVGLSEALKGIAKNPANRLEPGDRGAVGWAGFFIADMCKRKNRLFGTY